MSTPSSESRPFPLDYFLLAYAISWALWGVAWLFARNNPPVTGTAEDLVAAAPPEMLILVLAGVFGPFLSAFILTWRREGREGAKALWKSGWRVRIGWFWLLVVIALFPVIRILAVLVSGAGLSLEAFTQPLTLVGMGLFMYFLGGPFGEEFGWRGYALPRLLDKYNTVNASIILGVFWIAWHLPLFLIPGSPQAQIPLLPWAAGVTALALIMTWVHINVGGAVFAAIAIHTTANWATDLFRPAAEAGEGWSSADGLMTIFQIILALILIPILLKRSKPAAS
jgi:membrane protease YdiL (CAAX protease family)